MADNFNSENLLKMGIRAAQEGNKEGARVLLKQVVDADKNNDRAWVWMAYAAKTKADRLKYLKIAQKINPNNEAAKKGLAKMQKKQTSDNQDTLIFGMLFLIVMVLVAAAFFFIALVA